MAITVDLAAIRNGGAGDDVLGEIANRLRSVTDANRCFLGTEEQLVVSSIMRQFPEDIAELLEGRLSTRSVRVPLIKDIAADGTVEYDRRHGERPLG